MQLPGSLLGAPAIVLAVASWSLWMPPPSSGLCFLSPPMYVRWHVPKSLGFWDQGGLSRGGILRQLMQRETTEAGEPVCWGEGGTQQESLHGVWPRGAWPAGMQLQGVENLGNPPLNSGILKALKHLNHPLN